MDRRQPFVAQCSPGLFNKKRAVPRRRGAGKPLVKNLRGRKGPPEAGFIKIYGRIVTVAPLLPPKADLTVIASGGVAVEKVLSPTASSCPPAGAPTQPEAFRTAWLSVEVAAIINVPAPTL